ncbi:MAG: sigma-70 family RNA polymerase sigma factor [Pirellulales bacterium]|nr:sigma-70 family RNA polymerase sigma factor [Pirellulales bacterium]
MALSEVDRGLLERCLARQPRSWEDFVDRYMGLFVHVINHTAQCRSVRLTQQDRDDLCAEIFVAVIRDDFAVLRNFRGQSSLATYLTVVARRVVVREMIRQKTPMRLGDIAGEQLVGAGLPEQRITDREEVERLLNSLDGDEAAVVRLYHLEGKTYQEISASVGMPENSVGPTLSRARQKMRSAGAEPSGSKL